jgi:hypothetical protein
VLSFRFVKVLGVEADDCKGKDQLQEPEGQVNDVRHGEAPTAGHLGLRGGFRTDVAERERSTRRGVGSPEIVSRNSDCAIEKGVRYAVGCVVQKVSRMVDG